MSRRTGGKTKPISVVINTILILFFIFIVILVIRQSVRKAQEGVHYYEGYAYEILEAGIVLNSYEGTEANLVIPMEIKGNKVTSIAQGCFSSNLTLEKVTVPGTIRGVGIDSFKGCINLKEVVMEEGVEMIASYAFRNCKALETVTLPRTMESIGMGAFEDASDFTLRGYEGTASQTFAEKNEIRFEAR